jgi:hypothetical protein
LILFVVAGLCIAKVYLGSKSKFAYALLMFALLNATSDFLYLIGYGFVAVSKTAEGVTRDKLYSVSPTVANSALYYVLSI